MRCKRCHAVIEPGRKTCPNCGTLVRKRRGNFKLAAESGVTENKVSDFISDGIYNLQTAVKRDNRLLILIIAVPVILIGFIILISCGSCSCDCSCAGEEKTTEISGVINDSRLPMRQSYFGEDLFYIDSSSSAIMQRSSDENYSKVCDVVSASSLLMTGDGLYYSDGEKIYSMPEGFVPVSDGDRGRTVADCAGDPMFTLGGYFAGGSGICYYKNEKGGKAASVYAFDNASGSASLVLSGEVSDFGYTNGRLYFCRETENNRELCSCAMNGSDEMQVMTGVIDYQLGGGYVYATRADENGAILLCRYTSAGSEEFRWDMSQITGASLSGFAADDMWLCIVTEASDGGNTVYRAEHDGTELKRIGFFSTPVELAGVSGSWYAMDYETEGGKGYIVRDSLTDKTAVK